MNKAYPLVTFQEKSNDRRNWRRIPKAHLVDDMGNVFWNIMIFYWLAGLQGDHARALPS